MIQLHVTRKNHLLLFGYSLCILIISVIPISEPLLLRGIGIDKLIHGCIYVFLAILAVRAFSRHHPYAKGFFYAFCFGGAIEYIQYCIPWRSFELMDIVCNTGGALLGLIIFAMLKR